MTTPTLLDAEKTGTEQNGQNGHDHTSIDELRQQHAERYGVETSRVGTVRLELRKLQQMGTLVDLDFHGSNMFTTRATYSELGIPIGDMRRKRLRAGSKDLLPKKLIGRLRSIETRFRQSLEKHSYRIGAFGSYRWVPFTAYEAWRDDWNRLQGELAEWKEETLSRYDEFTETIVEDFTQIASEAWQALLARRGGDTNFVLVTKDGAEFDGGQKEAFVEHVVSKAVAKLPTREDVQTRLYVDYRTAVLLTQADVEADRLIAEQLRAEREAEAARVWEEAERRNEERRRRQNKLWEEEKEAQLRVREKEIKINAMRQAELEHARQQMAQMGSPLQEVFDSLRAQMYEDVGEILEGIRKNGRLVGRSSERVRNLVETFRLLNAHDDSSLEAALDELQARLADLQSADSEHKAISTDNLADQLEQIKDLTHEAAVAVQKRIGPSRFSHLEI